MSTSRDTIKESKVTIAFLALIVFSFVAYLYFLNISVVHVVMRKEASHDINQLKTEIAVLETRFIESQHTIASRMGTLEGYRVDSEKIFVMRDNTNLVLRDN